METLTDFTSMSNFVLGFCLFVCFVFLYLTCNVFVSA